MNQSVNSSYNLIKRNINKISKSRIINSLDNCIADICQPPFGTYLQWPLRRSAHTVMVHGVVLQLCAHLAVYMAALVLADVGQRLRSAEDVVVEAGEDVALPGYEHTYV